MHEFGGVGELHALHDDDDDWLMAMIKLEQLTESSLCSNSTQNSI